MAGLRFKWVNAQRGLRGRLAGQIEDRGVAAVNAVEIYDRGRGAAIPLFYKLIVTDDAHGACLAPCGGACKRAMCCRCGQGRA